MRAILTAAVIAGALASATAANASTPHVTFRLNIPANVARAFNRDAHTQADTYGYPVHGCAYTHARRIYGCSVSAPGDWQLLTRPRRHLYYEYIVLDNKISKRIRFRP